MSDLARPAMLIAAVLLVPVVPFLLFGSVLEARLAGLLDPAQSPLSAAGLVAGLLATDILLPVPASMISTFGGAKLGVAGGTLASWLGMSAGATLGYVLARWWGRPVVRWLCRADELERIERLADRYGGAVIAVTRAVPVLAEASVLLMGIHRLAWWRFALAAGVTNLCISLVYSIVGVVAQQYRSVPFALAVAIALPVLAATIVNRLIPK